MVSTPSSMLMSTLLLSTPGISRTMVSAPSASKMSVVDMKVRAGAVASCFFSISRFCCPCSSWGDMDRLHSLGVDGFSVDADGTRFVALRPWDEQGQHAVAVLGLDP